MPGSENLGAEVPTSEHVDGGDHGRTKWPADEASTGGEDSRADHLASARGGFNLVRGLPAAIVPSSQPPSGGFPCRGNPRDPT